MADMIESLERVLARSDSPDLVNVRSQLGGHAEMGQGVQPQPRDRLPPQAGPIAAGGAGTRRTAAAGQAPQGAVSVLGGEAPAPRLRGAPRSPPPGGCWRPQAVKARQDGQARRPASPRPGKRP